MLTPIKVPEHWATAGLSDIERELIGLLVESKLTLGRMTPAVKAALEYPDRIFDKHRVIIQGVRAPHVYPTRRNPQNGMTLLARSRAIRKPKNYVTVRWKLVSTEESYARNSLQ